MHEAMIISPKDSGWAPEDADSLVRLLLNIGLVDRLSGFQYEYGQHFSRLVSFLGCSPTLYRTDNNGAMFPVCVPPAFEQPVLLAGDAARPRCRSCKKPVLQWQQHVHNNRFDCPLCGQAAAIHELHWRRHGCFARVMIVIDGIMEGIAVPSDQLLAELRNLGGGDWDYTYYRGHQAWQALLAPRP